MRTLSPSRSRVGLVVFLQIFLAACSGEKPERPFIDGQRLVQPLNQQWLFVLSEPEALTTFSGVDAALDDSEDFDHVSWSLKLRNYISDDMTAYLAIDHAYKQGGFNGLVAGVEALSNSFGFGIPDIVQQAAGQMIAYDEETCDAIELGIKGTFLDNRLSMSAAIFYQRYEDHHVAQTNNPPEALGPIFSSFFLASIDNAEEVTTQGVEVNATYLFGEYWDVDARVAYADPQVEKWATRFCPAGENEAPDQLYCPKGDGDSLNRLPQWKANVQLGYRAPLGASSWELYSRLNWSWQDEPSEANNTDELFDTADQIGLTIGVTDPGLGLDIRAWGKNIGNSDTSINNFNPGLQRNGDSNLADAFQGSFNPGRQYGLTVRYDF